MASVVTNVLLRVAVRGIMCECAGAGACPGGAARGTCVTQPGGYCFATVEEVLDDSGRLDLERTAGCLPPDESGFMQVCAQYKYLYIIIEFVNYVKWLQQWVCRAISINKCFLCFPVQKFTSTTPAPEGDRLLLGGGHVQHAAAAPAA